MPQRILPLNRYLDEPPFPIFEKISEIGRIAQPQSLKLEKVSASFRTAKPPSLTLSEAYHVGRKISAILRALEYGREKRQFADDAVSYFQKALQSLERDIGDAQNEHKKTELYLQSASVYYQMAGVCEERDKKQEWWSSREISAQERDYREKALDILEKKVLVAPSTAHAYHLKANILNALKRFDEAKEADLIGDALFAKEKIETGNKSAQVNYASALLALAQHEYHKQNYDLTFTLFKLASQAYGVVLQAYEQAPSTTSSNKRISYEEYSRNEVKRARQASKTEAEKYLEQQTSSISFLMASSSILNFFQRVGYLVKQYLALEKNPLPPSFLESLVSFVAPFQQVEDELPAYKEVASPDYEEDNLESEDGLSADFSKVRLQNLSIFNHPPHYPPQHQEAPEAQVRTSHVA